METYRMRPPACVSCKWGTGTTCEKPSSTGSSKELEAKLKEMMAARTEQDGKWFAPPRDAPVKKEELQQYIKKQ